jgi:hypothetical protein
VRASDGVHVSSHLQQRRQLVLILNGSARVDLRKGESEREREERWREVMNES